MTRGGQSGGGEATGNALVGRDFVVRQLHLVVELLRQVTGPAEAKEVADRAHVALNLAKRQHLGDEVICYGHAVKIDALTLLGEFLEGLPKNPGTKGRLGPGPGRGTWPPGA
jgi:hypothetical protein